MVIHGHVENGVVIPHGNLSLPNGTEVTIVLREQAPANNASQPSTGSAAKRIQLPLVHCDQPGSVHLTGERIAEILDEEDAAPGSHAVRA
jgi:hypothetical protein